ncbi:phosphoribosylanthranilate isomerase [Anaeromicropila populeti]|uniref:N-(5'-phosphoribosyl)anthranilate isomerase n=1 Tax=Anaeromicropila populeti TaxID=37658 RepID=A0A1I6JY56_9FIRM|nr:phosphoribosylanthranilate isomerase [Anaeromicropila populeti]SFR83925.1 phosphoribosylanthranilate isomerase [Anaeromicropila populeti]
MAGGVNLEPQIKICGLVNDEDARLLVKYKIQYAGFVLFYPKSKRCVSIDQAREIMKNLSPEIKTVAVTVSPAKSQIEEIERAGFDLIQIHGTMDMEGLEHSSIPILRAVNVDTQIQMEKFTKHIEDKISGYVFDGKNPGNGEKFDWALLDTIVKHNKKIMLAGGLNADNVRRAIETASPDIVDVSSGVEKDCGIGKEESKIKAFVKAVRNQ